MARADASIDFSVDPNDGWASLYYVTRGRSSKTPLEVMDRSILGGTGACRLGSLRYSRFGNLRYEEFATLY